MYPTVTLPYITRNHPRNATEAKRYPPDKFPLRLNIFFIRAAVGFNSELKKQLKQIPKSKVKYRQTSKYYYAYDCYGQSIDSLSPVIDCMNRLSEMWVRCGAERSDFRIYPIDLQEQAKTIKQECMMV